MGEFDGYWWIDTGWGTGTVRVKDGKVIDTPKHFRKFIGKDLSYLQKTYTVERD